MEVISIVAFGILLLVNIKNDRKRIITVDGWDMEYTASERQLTIRDFESIEAGTSLNEIESKLGEPDGWTRSGILQPVYVLKDNTAVELVFADAADACNNLKEIVVYDKFGEKGLVLQDKLVNYMEALLHMELNNYVERVEGGVTIGENVEIAMIKVKISAENENTVTGLLENKFINLGKNDTDEIPPFPSDSLLSEIKTKEWKNTFLYVVEGKRAKTREIYIYVTLDKTGMYLYFWDRCIFLKTG